jgi:hypothetical protein
LLFKQTMATVSYRCPYCETLVEIDREAAGDVVACRNPACGQQFRAEVPSAQPILSREAPVATGAADRAGSAHDEQVLTTVHPVLFRGRPLGAALCFLAVGLGVAGVLWSLAGATAGDAGFLSGSAILVVSLVLLAVAAGTLLVWWVQTRWTSLSITDERTLLTEGIISRETSEVRHRDIRNLRTDQSIVQRLLGVGTLAISSAGQDDFEITVRGVSRPDELASLIREQQ